MTNQHKESILPLEYSWQGWLQYGMLTPGHQWDYVNKDKWLIQVGKDLVPLNKSAKEVKKIIDKINKASGVNKQKIESPLLNWLCNDAEEKMHCDHDFSVIFNNIIREDGSKKKQFKILVSCSNGNTTMDIRGLPPKRQCWFYFPEWGLEKYLANFILVLVTKGLIKTNQIEGSFQYLTNRFKFIRIFHKYQPIKIKVNKGKNCLDILFDSKTKVVDYVRGRVCNCLPIPGPVRERKKFEFYHNEPERVKTPEVVVSPVVSKTLIQLSHIWEDTFARSVLLSAPPGSGKDDFVTSIPYGQGRSTSNMQIISMADCSMNSILDRLYGRNGKKGLISKAENSAMFMDEIHQPGPSEEQSLIRASLLRTLEAGKYYPIDGTKLCDAKTVLFTMATSIPLIKLKEYKPPDFWTRMTYAVEIAHPLDFTTIDERDPRLSEVISNFFRHFWWMGIEKFYEMEPVFCNPPLKILHEHKKVIVYWQVYSMSQVLGFKCDENNNPNMLIQMTKNEDNNFAVQFAKIFIEYLSELPFTQEVRNFSIRGIRNIITRLFSIAASNVEKGHIPWETKDDFTKDVKAAFREIFQIANLG